MTAPEHLIEAAIKAATIVTKQYSAGSDTGVTVGSSIETTITTRYLNRPRAIAVVEAILQAQETHP